MLEHLRFMGYFRWSRCLVLMRINKINELYKSNSPPFESQRYEGLVLMFFHLYGLQIIGEFKKGRDINTSTLIQKLKIKLNYAKKASFD